MLSFIIPAHNEALLIAEAISGIHAAAKAVDETYEIIVADDASTDGTSSTAQEHGARVIPVSNRQIAATRNAGARVARGDRLIFVDADTIVSEGAVRGAVQAFADGAAGGGCAVRFDGWIPWHARMVLPVMMLLYRWLGVASGSFMFCTRETFEKTGGFDEELYASEELWMSRAIARCGRFVFVREHVTTSGRKLRTHSARELYGVLMRLSLGGMKTVKKREGLDIWYGPRREDPQCRANRRAGSLGPSD